MSDRPSQPHPDPHPVVVRCAVLTISDTRTPETDKSGQLMQQLLLEAGHEIVEYAVLKDDPQAIQTLIYEWRDRTDIDTILLNGGTGIAPRDTTYEAIANLLQKQLPGFGELFRSLSYQEIGSRAMASRAIAGVYGRLLIFSLPGSSNAVRLGMETLILPELSHLVRQLSLPSQGA